IVDGQIEKESSHALYGLSFTNTKNLVIGTERNNSRFFKGDLDEIRIYNKALESTQLTSVGSSNLPQSFFLDQNYPNPFNPSTTIEYHLTSRAKVEIGIYNSLGMLVRALVSEITSAGNHRVMWDGRDNSAQQVSSGTYFYQLKAGGSFQAKKMLLLK
ncbi:MAG: T9SS type A sorting domain-containing protein, partial [Ignavibacteriales bacterium]|nr:T9SS type A sorting domain-containing protein [Ignavibacteriales bacterium]